MNELEMYQNDRGAKSRGSYSVSKVPAMKYFEDSVSIETSDEDAEIFNAAPDMRSDVFSSIHDPVKAQQSESEFQAEITRLKSQSTKNFKNKWEEILAKYSSIDDEKQSDEIDLATGEIIKDNGHLRSLGARNSFEDGFRLDSDIWSLTYDLDKRIQSKHSREVRVRGKKRELKEKLKEQQQFYNESLHRDQTPLKADDLRKNMSFFAATEENLLSLKPSPTKKKKLSPEKFNQSLTFSDSNNSRLASPRGPKDRQLSNPSLRLFLDDIPWNDEDIPSSGSDYEIYPDNPFLMRKVFPKESSTSDNNYTSWSDSQTELASVAGSSQTSVNDSINRCTTDSLKRTKNHLYDPCVKESASKDLNGMMNYPEEGDFEDQYSIVSESKFVDLKLEDTKVYNCAFDKCSYCTGNRNLYQNHLLDRHGNELQSIGYPIKAVIQRKDNISVSNDEVKKLSKQFPLICSVPPLVSSTDGNVYTCNKSLGKKNLNCRKFFTSKKDLDYHQSQFPRLCSHRKQVLLCPILGCGYMTDMGFLEWRKHFIEAKHHISPEHRYALSSEDNYTDKKGKEKSSELLNDSYKYLIQRKQQQLNLEAKLKHYESNSSGNPEPNVDIMEEINDIFSDSSSAKEEKITGDIYKGTPSQSCSKLEEKTIEKSNLHFTIVSDPGEDNEPSLENDKTGYESIDELFS
ncbi:Piso0_001270 [Millerozyma farinosa CBS 7064]|uniref:Piso0_001270 protein n=1 Tax=Pichia sorbitophila (strain ATCC MYA-4447 / BCRC 22081 / CBS 7064 / NBRC 10061 / NRRL Y-12695) TaxID=559304 RepID=G8YMQ1_PICSO|nr:Piso0_001270 [Millerozyma farinosa CBS 7064]